MTNYEWLIQVFGYFPEQLVNPTAPDKMLLILIIGLITLGLFIFIIGLCIESQYQVGIITTLGLLGIGFGILFTVFYILDYSKYQQQLTAYNIQAATYEEDKAKFETERERVTQQRLTYTVYLDGQEIEMDKVIMANYKAVINDSEQRIYLSTKS